VAPGRPSIRRCPAVGKTRLAYREPPWITTSGLLPPRCRTVGTDCRSLRQAYTVEKTRRRLSHLAQSGRVMSIQLFSTCSSLHARTLNRGSVLKGSRCEGLGFSMNPNWPTSGLPISDDFRPGGDRQEVVPQGRP